MGRGLADPGGGGGWFAGLGGGGGPESSEGGGEGGGGLRKRGATQNCTIQEFHIENSLKTTSCRKVRKPIPNQIL